jgi:hypothetical protein
MRFFNKRKLEMLRMLSEILKKHKKTLVARVPALNDEIDGFVAKIDGLHKVLFSTKNVVVLSALEKKSIRDGFTEAILTLAGMVQAAQYKNARKTKSKIEADTKTKSRLISSHFTRTDLNRSTAENLLKTGKQVIAAAKRVKFTERYGITAGDIREAEAYLKEFDAIKTGPKKRKKEVAGKNEALNEGIREAMEMLKNSMDPMVYNATREDPVMRGLYKSARKILPRHIGAMSDKERAYRQSRERAEKKGE